MSIPANEVMQIRFRTVNGITIRYAESDGHQDSFILLTCPWPESLYAFLPIWQPLSEHSHLLAIDLPGFGQSERRNDLLSPQTMGEFLIRLVDEWELDTPHVVGPDIGTAASLFAWLRQNCQNPSTSCSSCRTTTYAPFTPSAGGALWVPFAAR